MGLSSSERADRRPAAWIPHGLGPVKSGAIRSGEAAAAQVLAALGEHRG
ncbi:MAG TPA: hypothetical protein VGY51_07275 [Acidimicrobiales bacterium]|nr:hypothetical protein [Acidimicrobiales bacterium]